MTFFATWHRLNPKYIFQNENVGDKIGNLIVGIFIRFIAAGLRSIIISIGLMAEVVVLVSFGFILAAWVSWPLVFFMMITKGVALMFS
jgi:hypothetical protein